MPQTATESTVYRNARADFRNQSTDAIEAYLEAASFVLADPESDPVERDLAGEGARAAEHELKHRRAVARMRAGRPTDLDRSRAQWATLAKLVRAKVEVPTVLALAGVIVSRASRQSGANEFHSACPICRDGVDRLVSWGGPNGRAWCRQCRWSTDVIGVASLIVKTGNFRDCVRFLAEYAGVEGGGR